MGRVIICPGCNREKEHYAKGLCKKCYSHGYREGHREEARVYMRRHREENPEKVAASMRRWQQKNLEKVVAYNRQWRRENPKKKAAYDRRWQQANPEKVAARGARRRARKKGVANTLTTKQVEYEMNIARAMYPDEELHLHHLVPISKEGNHSWGNVIFVPAWLNARIGDRLPEKVYEQGRLSL